MTINCPQLASSPKPLPIANFRLPVTTMSIDWTQAHHSPLDYGVAMTVEKLPAVWIICMKISSITIREM
jgi:hypothetical protein